MKSNQYAQFKDPGWYVAESRVSLDSIIYAFHDGLSPGAIARECFPTLSLEQIYGAITFYLANRKELDAYLKKWEANGESLRQKQREAIPDLTIKMAEARQKLLAPD